MSEAIAEAAGPDLLKLPFDQYQRYRVAADLLANLGLELGSRVLEVGGAPGPLEAFLPDHEVLVTDLNGTRPGRYAVADGARLPFADATFDAVVTLDTLEHVPGDKRPDFLSEARRVSRDLVVLSAPFEDPDLVLAEDALNGFIRQRFGGDFATLDEHRENGLPLLDPTVEALTADRWSTAVLPSGYLPRWLLGMIFHHELLASGLPELPDLHAYYNATVSPLDCREPSYRKVIVASCRRRAEELGAATDKLRTDGEGETASRVALSSIAATVLARRLPSTPGVASLELEVAGLSSRLADAERQLADREGHLLELRRALDRVTDERDVASERLVTYMRDHTITGAARRAYQGLRRFSG